MGQASSSSMGTNPPLNVTVTRATPDQLRQLQAQFPQKTGGGKTRKNIKKRCSTKKHKGGKQRK